MKALVQSQKIQSINIENLEKNRLTFSKLCLTNWNERLHWRSNTFDEAIKQKSTLGPTIPELISKHGAIPGIKVTREQNLLLDL